MVSFLNVGLLQQSKTNSTSYMTSYTKPLSKVKKRELKKQISEKTLIRWKLASYYAMYQDMVEETGIAEFALREAIKHGNATETTEKAINKFFDKKEKSSRRS